MMTENEILQKVKNREINCEQAFESLVEIGLCPNLLNDDYGHWAVKCYRLQNIPREKDPDEITITVCIEAKYWKNSIYEALIFSMQDFLEEDA